MASVSVFAKGYAGQELSPYVAIVGRDLACPELSRKPNNWFCLFETLDSIYGDLK